jgi:hypothetical protein
VRSFLGKLAAASLMLATAHVAHAASISGSVTNASHVGLAGVTVTLSLAGGSATTNASGAYTISGVASGVYTVTPSLTGYTFTPASRQVTVTTLNVGAVNFTVAGSSGGGGTPPTNPPNTGGGTPPTNPPGTGGGNCGCGGSTNPNALYTISGKITGGSGVTVIGLKVQLLGPPPPPPASQSSTNVKSAQCTSGGNPPSGGNAPSGNNPPPNNNQVPPGANVPPPPPVLATTTTDSSGNFSFSVKCGKYGVAPVPVAGIKFDPPSIPVVVTNANVGGVNFTATAVSTATYSISGTIAGAAGVTVSGLTVSLLGPPPPGGASPPVLVTTTTDSSGHYTFTGVKPGLYGVAPKPVTGVKFDPANRPAPVTNANVTGVNFTASAVSTTAPNRR